MISIPRRDRGIMRMDHRADAVLQLRNHLAAAVVRGRVGGKENHHVDLEPHRITANLHVALFENVEQADLHQFVQFRQLVHGEDAPVHAGNQAEVQGSSADMLVPAASLAGSISPITSANFVPGASRSA